MCIIMTDDIEPSSTHLINVPVAWDDPMKQQTRKGTLLIYTNDLEHSSNSQKSTGSSSQQIDFTDPDFTSKYIMSNSPLNVNDTYSTGIMIVPIPNVNNEMNFGLVDVTTQQMKSFRSLLFSECKKLSQLGMFSFDTKSYGIRSDNSTTLKVHEVGNYSISVAPSLNALEHMIDWTKFNLPRDFERRKRGFSDKNKFPLSNYAYIVAKANKSVKDDGFGIVYYNNNNTYFPTIHEDNGGTQRYDVKCYDCFSPKQTVRFNMSTDIYHLDNQQTLDMIFGKNMTIPLTMSHTGSSSVCRIDSENRPQNVNYIEITGFSENKNLVY